MSKIRVIKVDPYNKTITEAFIDSGLKPLQEAVGADIITMVRIDEFSDCFIDDEGLLVKSPKFFTIKGIPCQAFAGNGIITGFTDDGDTISTTMTLKEAEELFKFISLAELMEKYR